MITQEQFTDQAAFAKVVETTQGPALLIGGHVLHVIAPGFDGADYLSVALRRLARGDVSLVGEAHGIASNSPGCADLGASNGKRA